MNPFNVLNVISNDFRSALRCVVLSFKDPTYRPGATHDDVPLLRTQPEPTPTKIFITTTPSSINGTISANARTIALFRAEREWTKFVPRIGRHPAHLEEITLGELGDVHHIEVPLGASSTDATSFVSIVAVFEEAAIAYEKKMAGLTRHDADQLLREFLGKLREVGLGIEDTDGIVNSFDLL